MLAKQMKNKKGSSANSSVLQLSFPELVIPDDKVTTRCGRAIKKEILKNDDRRGNDAEGDCDSESKCFQRL